MEAKVDERDILCMPIDARPTADFSLKPSNDAPRKVMDALPWRQLDASTCMSMPGRPAF
jgi:hypothetical protein